MEGIEIRPLAISQLRENDHLCRAHAMEYDPDWGGRYSPVWEGYEQIESAGALIAFGAWRGVTLLGYILATVTRDQHFEYYVGHMSALYVEPSARGRGLGTRLLTAVGLEAQARGARSLMVPTRAGNAFEDILKREGYTIQETLFRIDLQEARQWVSPQPSPSSP